MGLQHRRLDVTTNASGAGTNTDDMVITGIVYAVKWIDGDFDTGVDAVLSVTETPEDVDNTVLTLTNADDDAWYIVREQATDNSGAAAASVYEPPVIAGKLKLSVTNGGDTKTGGCVVYYLTD